MNQQPQPHSPRSDNGGLLLSLLCLALYRNGGEIVLSDLNELKESLFIPSIEPVRDGVVKLKVTKYTKQVVQKTQKSRRRHANSK